MISVLQFTSSFTANRGLYWGGLFMGRKLVVWYYLDRTKAYWRAMQLSRRF